MRYNRFLAALALVITVGCAQKKDNDFHVDELVLDSERSIAEGSYVQGVELGSDCRVTVPYTGGNGGTAVFSAVKTNGIFIAETTVQIAKGEGEAVLTVSGTPLNLEETYLQIQAVYNGKTFLSSVEVSILEDSNPDGEITFSVDKNEILSLVEPVSIEFTVTPTMTSVTASGEPEGLRVSVSPNTETGKGTITFTPSANFFNGEVTLTASFGAREAKTAKVKVNAFAGGEGTAAEPFLVNSQNATKIQYATTQALKLTENISLGSNWVPAASEAAPFNGSLDGDGHTITLALDSSSDNVALFAYVGESATFSALTLAGSVKGGDRVAALAANSASVPTGVNSQASVIGENHVAALVAAGAGKDADVIEFTTVPQTVNIIMGQTSASDFLGIVTSGTVVFDVANTGTSWEYNHENGAYTVTKGENFQAGEITFYVKLSDLVRSTERRISILSKKMYESGTGTPADPYIVADGDQLSATIGTYPDACISLSADCAVSSWETLSQYSGTLDGAGHSVTGLTAPFINVLSSTGAVKNIKFKDVNIALSSNGNNGVVVCESSGLIDKVAVSGTLASSTSNGTSNSSGFGSVVGKMKDNAVTSDCWSSVEMTIGGGSYSTGGIVGLIKETSGVTISHCTFAGKIMAGGNYTQIGGILGRKTNTNQGSTDIIEDCLVSGDVNISGTGSNMVGGVFGALQGATVNGDYVGGLTIVRTAFTGNLSAGTAVGGIGGVCCSVTDCFVSGNVQATTNTGSTGGSAGVVSAAKGDVKRCVVAGSRISGTNLAAFSTAGIISKQNGNAPKASACAVIAATLQDEGKTILGSTNNLSGENNKWFGVEYINNGAYVPGETAVQDGEAFAAAPTQADFEALGYDFTDVWKWNAAGYPELKNAGAPAQVTIQ